LAVNPQQKREMTLAALLNLLEGVTARGAVLMVFEDAHWIDPTSLDLLDRIVARDASLPVLLVVTARPELQPAWVGQPHVTMLPLSRLGRRDSVAIVGAVTRNKALPKAIVEQVLAATDGVPLFVEELTTTLLESSLLRETADSYVRDRPLPQLAIPTTLQALLVARLDRLGSGKDVAVLGAAIGRGFSPGRGTDLLTLDAVEKGLESRHERDSAASAIPSRRAMRPSGWRAPSPAPGQSRAMHAKDPEFYAGRGLAFARAREL
jgi:predicted ATPase